MIETTQRTETLELEIKVYKSGCPKIQEDGPCSTDEIISGHPEHVTDLNIASVMTSDH